MDSILFSLITMAGIAALIGLLVYSFQAAERRAEQDTTHHNNPVSENTELGGNR